MRKTLQTPRLQEWQLYNEYENGKKTFLEIGVKYNLTREKVRKLVVKVQRYLRNVEV